MEKSIYVSRVFPASVEDIWKIWTDPELVKQWWGPDRFTCPVAEINFKEGARSLVCMEAPEEFGGQRSYSLWTYTKIVHLQSIEFIQNLATAQGVKLTPPFPGMPPDFPEDIRTVVNFRVMGKDQTEMTVTEYAEFGQITHFAKLGLEQCFGKMEIIFSTLH